MPTVTLPYGKDSIPYQIPDDRFAGELVSHLREYQAPASQADLVAAALANPIGSPRLSELARGKKNVVLIASDHTRPVPSKVIVPQMLAEIRSQNPDADITILIATGCHRGTTRDELVGKFGPQIVQDEKIVVHDCDESEMTHVGQLPSGGDLVVNRIAVDADLLVAEGFIEPHFFAGYSGGRKSVLPGVASRTTVLYNHNAAFIASDKARTGVLDGNPIHADMLYAARTVGLAFICNVVINEDKEVVYAVAGDADEAHRTGCRFLASKCQVDAAEADIVISTNGGYPLDQNIYQAVKGMTAAEACVRPGGVVVMLAKSNDGHGGEEFYRTFRDEKDLGRLTSTFLSTPKDETRVDQWESQILARVLTKASVVYVSDAPAEMVTDMHMTPAHSVEEGVTKAEQILRDQRASIVAIPDGVAVMVV
ncbi:nickel-dependent lactate racemase [Brooklawnia cerclae]|uniref:Nickel-dependent lactate racemase n=1 Tax=Brooklawnia cerclae TaxID=349934 RepID=A0ABX0SC16_9ACTN|nr:nickel-dependent lactate racemase [Brooklawnia cerclae]NIH55925.1 nickel-dependent lactate racemase [Brooklawnia cerclae]